MLALISTSKHHELARLKRLPELIGGVFGLHSVPHKMRVMIKVALNFLMDFK